MFDKYQEDNYREHKFLAAINGIDLDKELKKSILQNPSQSQNSNFIFGDPAEYEKLPEDKRVALSNEMMGKHRKWASNLNVNM